MMIELDVIRKANMCENCSHYHLSYDGCCDDCGLAGNISGCTIDFSDSAWRETKPNNYCNLYENTNNKIDKSEDHRILRKLYSFNDVDIQYIRDNPSVLLRADHQHKLAMDELTKAKDIAIESAKEMRRKLKGH